MIRGILFGLLFTAAAGLILVMAVDVAGTRDAFWFGLGAAVAGGVVLYTSREDA